MNLQIDPKSVPKYFKSQSRISGFISEIWAEKNLYCVNCGQTLSSYPQNNKVNDFYCAHCGNTYQLKSSRTGFSNKVKGAAYQLLAAAVNRNQHPNYFLLEYVFLTLKVKNVILIPKQFLCAEQIERRKALPATARRAGWVGCNILIENIPEIGRIYVVQNQKVLPKESVMRAYQLAMESVM